MGELDKTLKALNKKFGDNYIGIGSEILDKDYTRNSLGVFALDMAIGGGIPERKVMMLAGKESAGKTTTMLLAIAATQKKGGIAALIDVEHNFDPIYAAKLGVNVEKLIIAQTQTIEQASDTIEPLIMTGELSLICLDSIAAAPSEKELEESAEKGSMGGKAKVIGLMMNKITARLNDVKNPVRTSILLLNQVREKIGVMYGDPSYTPGGKTLHHLSDIIVWLRPDSEPVGGKEAPRGLTVKFKVTKNRTYPPFKAGTYDLISCEGADNVGSLLELGTAYGVILRTGAWYQYGDVRSQGMLAFRAALSPAIIKELQEKVLEAYKNPPILKANDDELTVEVDADA